MAAWKYCALGLGWLMTACAGEHHVPPPGDFAATPAAVQRSATGLYQIALYSSPAQAPIRGENYVRLEFEPQDQEYSEVAPELVTFMPAMGHGSGTTPTLTAVQGRHYTFEQVVFNMPGRWELRLTVESEADDGTTLTDNTVFKFDVE